MFSNCSSNHTSSFKQRQGRRTRNAELDGLLAMTSTLGSKTGGETWNSWALMPRWKMDCFTSWTINVVESSTSTKPLWDLTDQLVDAPKTGEWCAGFFVAPMSRENIKVKQLHCTGCRKLCFGSTNSTPFPIHVKGKAQKH